MCALRSEDCLSKSFAFASSAASKRTYRRFLKNETCQKNGPMLWYFHMINVQIEKNPNESSINLIKRFTKRVQSAGILRKVRSHRYKIRVPSEYTKKKHTLAVLGRQAETKRLIKLGKIIEKAPRR